MNTIAYVLILIGLIIMRGVSRGRNIADLPDDLGDLFIGAVSGDAEQVKEVLSRRTEEPSPAAASPAAGDVNKPVGKNAKTQGDLIALGKSLRERGYIVGQGPPPFGPIGKHSKTSYHYKSGPTGIVGMALDINWSPASQEPAKLDALAAELKAAGWDYKWREAGHFGHLHVDTQ